MNPIRLFALLAMTAALHLPGSLFGARERAFHYTDHERKILASVLVLEAASDGPEGMAAVLNVIHNRAGHRLDRMIAEAARPAQFTGFWSQIRGNQRDYAQAVRRAQVDRAFTEAIKLVLMLETGLLIDNTGGATHYHLNGILPVWTVSMDYSMTIGSHHFYRDPGTHTAIANG